jgi:integrase/recombinase XerC
LPACPVEFRFNGPPKVDSSGLADFSIRSVQALTARLNDFDTFLKKQRIRSIKKVSYRHLVDFTADYHDHAPSIHVTKSRVWAMRQFYHFLTLHRIVPKNIATGIPYPKIEKTVPQFLTESESSIGGQVQTIDPPFYRAGGFTHGP